MIDSRLQITTTYLQMFARPERAPGPTPDGGLILQAHRPTTSFYRYLYNGVGRDYLWTIRDKMREPELSAIIQNPAVEIYVLYIDGVPAGFAELDRRKQPDIELAYFGLLPEFIGRGLGGFFLRWAIHKAWDYQPRRLFVHTNTLDHPNALRNYQKQGFEIYDRQEQIILNPHSE